MDTDTFTTLIFNQMDHCSDILNIKSDGICDGG